MASKPAIVHMNPNDSQHIVYEYPARTDTGEPTGHTVILRRRIIAWSDLGHPLVLDIDGDIIDPVDQDDLPPGAQQVGVTGHYSISYRHSNGSLWSGAGGSDIDNPFI